MVRTVASPEMHLQRQQEALTGLQVQQIEPFHEDTKHECGLFYNGGYLPDAAPQVLDEARSSPTAGCSHQGIR